MPTVTQIDLVGELWAKHGPLALGWIVAIFLAVYVVLLHRRIYTIMKDYAAFAATANDHLAPVIESAVAVMSHIVQVIDGAVDRASARDAMMQELKGKLEIVIDAFIKQRFYTESTIHAAGEAAVEANAIKATEAKGKTRRLRKPKGET